jgi:phage terminase large subunit GpA-like protein
MTVQTHPTAVRAWRRAAAAAVRQRLSPPPRLSLSEWADEFRQLSRESSAEPGRWVTDRVPYLREIMDAVSNPDIPEMVLQKCSQIGYTEGVINNGVAYFIDQDPAPLMVVQPSDGDAEKWSKMKLAPMIRDTPRIRNRVADAKSRDSDNTILLKSFAGGMLNVTGATSPKGLAAMPARVLFLDEVDRYPASAGAEGDPVGIAKKRVQTYWNRKVIMGSTPTLKGLSRIEKAMAATDERRYEVPCPHCQTYQELRWGGPDKAYGLKWDEGKPETARYLCASCGTLIEEADKAAMVQAGRWVPTHPERVTPGWYLSALVSPFDGARWPVLVAEFLEAKEDPDQLKVFVNTRLGETWEMRGEQVTPEALEARAEVYPAEVPRGTMFLTAGVDVQADRLEVEIDGWGNREESWTVDHQRIHGDPAHEEVWGRLESVLARAYQHETGQELRIRATMIDSGYKTTEVYRFVRPRQHRNVWAAKGTDEKGKSPLSKASRANRDGVKVWTIGTVAMKDTLFARLRLQRPGPRYIHFRKPTETGLDAEYYAQFGAEKAVTSRGPGGQAVRKYVQTRPRNEAIDLKVLNLAALHALGPRVREELARQETVQQQVATEAEEAGAPPPPVPTRRPPPRKRGFVNRWKT